MQSYPHNIPLGNATTPRAVSASITDSTTFLANLPPFPPFPSSALTASWALNRSGSTGAAGTNYTKTGNTGATGDRGPTGYRGTNVFLLSSSWNTGTCTGVTCYAYQFQKVTGTTCNSGVYNTYYSTYNNIVDGVSPIYYDDICSSPATSRSKIGQYGTTIYGTTAAGTASFSASCGPGV